MAVSSVRETIAAHANGAAMQTIHYYQLKKENLILNERPTGPIKGEQTSLPKRKIPKSRITMGSLDIAIVTNIRTGRWWSVIWRDAKGSGSISSAPG